MYHFHFTLMSKMAIFRMGGNMMMGNLLMGSMMMGGNMLPGAAQNA